MLIASSILNEYCPAMKKIAILLRQSPFTGNQLQETIDIGLAYAAFDQSVSLIFTEQAVLACCESTEPVRAGFTDFLKQFGAFELYEIAETVVCADALALQGLAEHQLRTGVESRSAAEIAALLPTFDIVISI
ncbi:hypothetical protein EZV61_18395 [Corallincola luteus]|uniref:Sulfurtransferase complex subunit TusC n=1 Tax=Corallincola luteus TaxID=1775177 RepID=A0ABY2AFZ0_9GAMM|nr:hypothetical protein EZV61_18395 [Corallincola luteus]